LTDRRHLDARPHDFGQLFIVFGDSAAAAAQSERGADNHGITLLCRKLKRGIHVVCDDGGYAGLPDFYHRILENLPVLRLVNGFGGAAQQTDAVFFKKTFLRELHTQRQPRLAAQAR
jgi:hypothetical protein